MKPSLVAFNPQSQLSEPALVIPFQTVTPKAPPALTPLEISLSLKIKAVIVELEFQISYLEFICSSEEASPTKRSQDLIRRNRERIDEIHATLRFFK